MFFYLSKLVHMVLLPTALCLMAIAVGLWWSRAASPRPRLGRRLIAGGLCMVLVMGHSPFSFWLIRPLEDRFAKPDLEVIGPSVDGIILLGGFENTWVSRARGELTLTDAGTRFTEAVRLAQRLPSAKVVYAGGTSDIASDGSAAQIVVDYMVAFGITRERIALPQPSRTTYENALAVRQIAEPKPGRIWLVVTSATHMPRSIGTFRAQGFQVMAWPVGYVTRGGSDDWTRGLSFATDGLVLVELAVREWYGLVGYRISGRTHELFPAP